MQTSSTYATKISAGNPDKASYNARLNVAQLRLKLYGMRAHSYSPSSVRKAVLGASFGSISTCHNWPQDPMLKTIWTRPWTPNMME